MRAYIGAKIINAEPALGTGINEGKPGYKIIYPDGYESWSPEDTFEQAYRLVALAEFDLVIGEVSSELRLITDNLTRQSNAQQGSDE